MSIVWVCLALGFAIWVFGSGRYAIAIAAWIAPVFFLRALEVGGAFTLVGIWLAIFLATLIGYRGVIPVPGIIFPAIAAQIAAASLLPYIAHNALHAGFPGFAATLVFPLAWTTFEFLTSRLHPYGSWGALAYTQYGNLPLMQLASVTGIYGIGFLVSWSSAVAAWVWTVPDPLEQGGIGFLVFAGVWIAVLAFGGARLLRSTGEAARVAAIGWPEGILSREELMACLAPNLDASAIESLRSKFSQINDRLFSASALETASGAEILVWPEASALAFAADETELLAKCRDFVASARVHLLIGLACITPGVAKPFQNRAVFFAPDGGILFDYAKHIQVPGIEARVSAPGSARLPIARTSKSAVSAAICFDLDFPQFIRSAEMAKADLFLVPASDWREIGHLHLVHAIFRAIETGASLVRTARWGHSAAVDPCGRITGFMDHYATDDRRMAALLPTRGVRTIYSRIGDLFAWTCIAGLIGMVVFSIA